MCAVCMCMCISIGMCERLYVHLLLFCVVVAVVAGGCWKDKEEAAAWVRSLLHSELARVSFLHG